MIPLLSSLLTLIFVLILVLVLTYGILEDRIKQAVRGRGW